MFINKRKLKNKIFECINTELHSLKCELDSYADLIKAEMPGYFDDCGDGYEQVVERMVDISSDTRLSERTMKYVHRMKELVAKSEETIKTGKLILSALGLQD